MPGEVLTPEERAVRLFKGSVEPFPSEVAAAIRSAEEAALERARAAVCAGGGACALGLCPCRRIRALLKETP